MCVWCLVAYADVIVVVMHAFDFLCSAKEEKRKRWMDGRSGGKRGSDVVDK